MLNYLKFYTNFNNYPFKNLRIQGEKLKEIAMKYSNYHTHCIFCDGQGKPEEFVIEAINRKFQAIGFSSHAPLPLDEHWVMKQNKLLEYCETINSLKNKYKEIIDINLGMEIDYNPGAIGDNYKQFETLDLDYKIGAVHIMYDKLSGRYLCVDSNQNDFDIILREFSNNDIKTLVHNYYSLIRNMIKEMKPDIIAHFDLIKKNNKNNAYFNEEESWYKDEVLSTLEIVKEYDSIIEVNTGGIARKFLTAMYPSSWILQECKKLNIPIILSSDSHTPVNINFYFDEAAKILKDIGFKEQKILLKSTWVTCEL